MTLITKWYDKEDELSRYFMGYVALIFAIDSVTADALLLMLLLLLLFI